MARIKPECDDACNDCQYYTRIRAHISMDAYNDHPAEDVCEREWDCIEYEDCDEECDRCDAECDDRKEEG